MNKTIDEIPEPVLEILRQHAWPGNVRELQNFVARAVLLTEGTTLHPPLSDLRCVTPAKSSDPQQTLAEIERGYIAETLNSTNWVVGGRQGAAAKLGMPRTTLIARMRKLGLSRKSRNSEWPLLAAGNAEAEAFAHAG